jgi:hypothetical protein
MYVPPIFNLWTNIKKNWWFPSRICWGQGCNDIRNQFSIFHIIASVRHFVISYTCVKLYSTLFIVFARACHWSLSWATWIRSICSHPHAIFLGVRFLRRTRDSSLLHKVQTGCGVHPASCPVDTRRLSTGIKRARVKLTTYLHQVPRLWMRGTLPPFPFRRHSLQFNYEKRQIIFLQCQSLPGSVFPSGLLTEFSCAFLQSFIHARNTCNC